MTDSTGGNNNTSSGDGIDASVIGLDDWGQAPDNSGWETDAAQDTSGWENPPSTDWGEQPSTEPSWGLDETSADAGPVIRNGKLADTKDGTKKKRENDGNRNRGRGRGRGRGGYIPVAPVPRERMDDDALEERMAKIRAQNEKIRERREQIKADEEAFQALMIEERAKQAKNRKLQAQIDQTRELNAKRKMEKIGNREWDIAKQNEDWKQGRAWDVGKKDGDQQEKEGNPEQSEAAGKGFPLSRIEEKKREAAISSDKPKPKPRKEKRKERAGNMDSGGLGSANTGDNDNWGTANANVDDVDENAWGNANADAADESWGTAVDHWNIPDEAIAVDSGGEQT